MKNFILLLTIIAFTSITFSCEKKSSSSSSSTTTAVASPSVNTSITIGGSCWSFGACAFSPTLNAFCGSSSVELVFGSSSPIISGIYSITSGPPLPGQVRLKISDPPGQPSGFQWYSTVPSQTITVTTMTTGATIATFTNITCTQTSTSTPIVTASGTMACQ